MTAYRISPRTEEAQGLASHPATSVFVAANAGSGKTYVLARRVVRLLLSGASPSKILCLTYTKAAAAEMANRVFDWLSAWATAPRERLAADLRSLLGEQPSSDEIQAARRLFAQALETPGGLKIQTIHAFCEAILHQFPLEANVPGHFEVLGDAESAMLLAEARRLVVVRSGEAPDPALDAAFATALSIGGEWGLDQLVGEIVRKRDGIRRHVESAGGPEGATALLSAALGLEEGDDEAAILSGIDAVPGFDAPFRKSLAIVAATSAKATDVKLLARLAAVEAAADPAEWLATLRALCLTQKGEPCKPGSVATKAVADFFEDFAPRLDALVAHIAAIEDRLKSLRLLNASGAALVIADRLEADYALLKRRRGRLDFEDLIVRTADLLSRAEAAGWVHYKLDQGIDHVLLDEAQDTSPRQWQVMRQLVDEFFVGASARNVSRTLFAVGDEKQSIYSFQGASPAMFAAERKSLGRRAGEARLPFAEVRLHQSFRSVATVLDAVDRVFSEPDNRRGLSADDEAPIHETARGSETGLVEIWPVVQAARIEEPDDWLRPVDQQPDSSPANRLARRIAGQIEAWIGTPITVKGVVRPLHAGDVLILVRKRSGFVEAMGKALRERKVPVAGADRLVITDHIAIQDLMALGRVVANAEDELSLAAVLKSPLFDFSDDELMALAVSRDGSEPLYLALRRLGRQGGGALLGDVVAEPDLPAIAAKARNAFARLEALRGRSGFESVFAFYARLLGPEGGRARLTARLGQDAGEVIDAFLDLALAEEEAGQPGLDAFLADLGAAPPEIKREMDQGRAEVRIMTVHASKGLEAPVVFLVDPGSAPFSHAHGARLIAWDRMPGLYPDQAPGFLWRADKSLETLAVGGLKAEEKARAEEEYLRLLYVGMTRAADRLVVCGTAGVRGVHEGCWLQRVRAALEPLAEAVENADGEIVAWRLGAAAGTDRHPAASRPEPGDLRAIDLSALPPEALPPRPLAPSAAGAAHRLETDEDETAGGTEEAPTMVYVSPVLSGALEPSLAIRRGLLAHRLLEMLPDMPQETRAAAAERYVALAGRALPQADRAEVLESVLAVLGEPSFGPIFSPGSRAEVAISGTIELGGRPYLVSGSIDRLAEADGAVLVVDYKTNRPAPREAGEVPPAYVLQLALYCALLSPLYPGTRVRAAILFTEAPRLVEIDGAAMDEALRRRAEAGARAGPRDREPFGAVP